MTDTPQDRMKSRLATLGIPFDQIDCYGAQIVITCRSRTAATRWASTLAHFATVKRVWESVEYAKKNRNTVLRPTTYAVWRAAATI